MWATCRLKTWSLLYVYHQRGSLLGVVVEYNWVSDIKYVQQDRNISGLCCHHGQHPFAISTWKTLFQPRWWANLLTQSIYRCTWLEKLLGKNQKNMRAEEIKRSGAVLLKGKFFDKSKNISASLKDGFSETWAPKLTKHVTFNRKQAFHDVHWMETSSRVRLLQCHDQPSGKQSDFSSQIGRLPHKMMNRRMDLCKPLEFAGIVYENLLPILCMYDIFTWMSMVLSNWVITPI